MVCFLFTELQNFGLSFKIFRLALLLAVVLLQNQLIFAQDEGVKTLIVAYKNDGFSKFMPPFSLGSMDKFSLLI